MNNTESIRQIKGVGEKIEQLFLKLGIKTKQDLIHYYPKTYDYFQPPIGTSEVKEGQVCAVEGMIVKTPDCKQVRNLQVISTSVRDRYGILSMFWYNMTFLQKTLKSGSRYVFRGKVVSKNGRLVMEQAKVYTFAEYDGLLNHLQPIYPLTKGITNALIMKLVKQVLETDVIFQEHLPNYIKEKYQLEEYSLAVEGIHFPKDKESYQTARKRLVFEELFLFSLAVRKLRIGQQSQSNALQIMPSGITDELLKKLPYELTNAQKKAFLEIRADLSGKKQMNRLIQGDVGSGKTILALLTLLDVVCSGHQGAIMVPTEVLARQHYETFQDMFDQYHIEKMVVLLTGSHTAKEKRIRYEQIASGEASIIIGTHALIQEAVQYHSLALVVTDEQHRFGVNQRESLMKKGNSDTQIHVLVMSATPIPRTLAIILYGDLDISVIDELPKNRLPIKNCVVEIGYRENAYRFIEKEVKKGRQAYIICPMVEESELLDAENVTDYTEMLSGRLSEDITISCLHGKMKAKEKNDIMERYAANQIKVLVSTTVVEVGVNVPNATVMMIENAERFGLAQLHQLRGRVGRGKEQSYCIFVSTSGKKETMERLEILNKSNDGFYIASEDLKLRGPGDLFGIRQSGDMEFQIADIYQDADILKQAAEEAEAILSVDAELKQDLHVELGQFLEQYIGNGLTII